MKQRHLLALAAITAIFVIAALVAVMQRQSANQAAFARQPLFPDLAGRIESISKITVATSLETITLSRDAKGGWILPDNGGWAANFDAVRKTALALGGLMAIERRTRLAENHASLSLLAPGAAGGVTGKGFQIIAYDSAGAPMAALIVGKLRTPPDGNRPGVAYARRAGEDQTYLVEGDVNFPIQVSDWIDRMLFDIAAARIMSATVTPPAGPGYQVRRADPKAEFAFTEIPKDKEPALEGLAGKIAETVALLPLDNALPADRIDFTGAARVVHKMFDGLVLNSETVKFENRRWTRFAASFDADQAARAAKAGLKPAVDAKAQAEAINARTSGWAFMLPGMRAADLMRDYYSLFRNQRPLQSAPTGE